MALRWIPQLIRELEHPGTGFRDCTYCQSRQADLSPQPKRSPGLPAALAGQERAHLTSTCGGLDMRLTAAPAHGCQELVDLAQREGVVQSLQGIDGRNHGTSFKTWKETQSENE